MGPLTLWIVDSVSIVLFLQEFVETRDHLLECLSDRFNLCLNDTIVIL